jgi:hypothetical protein
VQGLLAKHSRHWSKDYVEHPERLGPDIEDLLVDVGLLAREPKGSSYPRGGRRPLRARARSDRRSADDRSGRTVGRCCRTSERFVFCHVDKPVKNGWSMPPHFFLRFSHQSQEILGGRHFFAVRPMD